MKNIGIVGASGYTGIELVRLAAQHPNLRIVSLVADRNAGKSMEEIVPAFRHLDLPGLVRFEELDTDKLDLVFCALPHGTSQNIVAMLIQSTKVVDLSADFRLRDPIQYEYWYGRPHDEPELQKRAIYGLTEFYRNKIKLSDLVACTGCNSATCLYALLPLVQKKVISLDDIIIDLKTGVSGAGRTPRVTTLHAEVSEGCQAYNVERHRHMAEFDQEFSLAANQKVTVSFTPHLVPQNRGILASIYVRGAAEEIHQVLCDQYKHEPFIIILPIGQHPSTRDVRGSNYVHIGVVPDRLPNRSKVFSSLDNLIKGSSGQALQNANLMLGLNETEGLTAPPLIP